MTETMELSGELLKRRNLIVRNLQEVLGLEKLTKQLSVGKNIHVYWGTATTGRPHIGYFVPMQKIADLLRAGIRVTILFADLHASLDNLKSTFVVLENRVLYYEYVIKALLTSLNVPLEKLHFVKGSTYQLSAEYTQNVLKLCGCVSQRDALKAGAEVVKQVESPLLSGLFYPLLQALDEQFLKVDGQFGGVDQRKIFILAEEQLPKLKFGKRFHLMNSMVPGLTGSKMSSSEENTKIDLLDSAELVAQKINSAVCLRKSDSSNSELENGILSFFKFVVFPILQNFDDELAGEDGWGEFAWSKPISIFSKHYTTYEAIETDFEAGHINEVDLKSFLVEFLNGILASVREKCDNDEMMQIIEKAYPLSNEIANTTNLNGVEAQLEQKLNMDAESARRYSEILNGMECLNPLRLQRALQERRPLRALYRCSAKGRVNLAHLAALIQLKRIRESARIAGVDCECAVLVSDLGAYLDNVKCSWATMERRSKYYEIVLKEFMKVINLENVEICHSRCFEYNRDYVLDMYKAISKVTRDESALVPGNTLACHLCPIYFTLDLLHFGDGASNGGNIDIVLVGENQKKFIQLSNKIFHCLAEQFSPSAFIIPEVIGMNGQRMSSTQPDFLLEPLDTPKQVHQKVAKSFCEPGNLNENVSLRLAEMVLFPVMAATALNSDDPVEFSIERSDANGGNLILSNINEVTQEFASQKLHPTDLKAAVVKHLNEVLFGPVREGLGDGASKILREAFPPAAKGGTKSKKL